MITWPLKGVLFDLDGTLLDTAPGLSMALNRVLDDAGKPLSTPDSIRPWVWGGKMRLLNETMAITEHDPTYDTHAKRFLDHYATCYGDGSKPFPGVHEGLSALTTAKIPWGIVTNKHQRFALPLIHKMGWSPDCVITADQVAHPKPHPIPIQTALLQLNLEPEQALYVGDAKTDVQSAKDAHVPASVVLFGYVPDEDTARSWGADVYWNSPSHMFSSLLDAFKRASP